MSDLNGWYVKDSDGRPYWYEDGVIYALVGYAKRGSKGSAEDALVGLLAERDALVRGLVGVRELHFARGDYCNEGCGEHPCLTYTTAIDALGGAS